MKKLKLLIALTAVALMVCGLCGCKDNEGNFIALPPNFSRICRHGQLDYVKDVDTDIMYIYYGSSYHAGLSAYYNKDGQPMTYAEFKEAHTARYH